MKEKWGRLFNSILDEQKKTNELLEQLIRNQALVGGQVFLQSKIQSKIFGTKGEKKENGLSQQEFYDFVRKELLSLSKKLRK